MRGAGVHSLALGERAVLARLRTLEEEAFAAPAQGLRGPVAEAPAGVPAADRSGGLLTAVKSSGTPAVAWTGWSCAPSWASQPKIWRRKRPTSGFWASGTVAARLSGDVLRLPLAHAGQGMEGPYFALEQRCERLYGLFGQTLEAPELRERVARL